MLDTNEMDKFRDFMNFCMEERIERLNTVLMDNEKYRSLSRLQAALHKQIGDALPEGSKIALFDYNNNENEMSTAEQSFFYEHGFLDAVMLLRVVIHGNL